MPGILADVASEFDGTQATLLAARASTACGAPGRSPTTTTPADAVDELSALGTSDIESDGFVAALLCAGASGARRALGAARAGSCSREDQLFLSTVADVLAPALDAAENAHRLESEVAARTREIDEQRRFIEKIIDSLPVGLYVIDRALPHPGVESQARDRAPGRVARRGDRPHDLRDPASPAGRAAAQRVRERVRDRPDAAVPDRVDERSASRARIASARSRCARRREGGLARHHDRRRHHRVASGRSALRPGGKARRDRHARRGRHARDQQSAGDDRRLRRDARRSGSTSRRSICRATTREASRSRCRSSSTKCMRCKGIIDGLLDFSRPKSTTKVARRSQPRRSRKRSSS